MKLQLKTTDGRLRAVGGVAFTPEGDGPGLRQSERERQMAEFSVRHDGVRYQYNGYRYDRWEDAVAYARLVRGRLGQVDAGGAFLAGKRPAPITDAEYALMKSLGIRLEDGAYWFESFRYDNLSDAVNYAKRQRGDRS